MEGDGEVTGADVGRVAGGAVAEADRQVGEVCNRDDEEAQGEDGAKVAVARRAGGD